MKKIIFTLSILICINSYSQKNLFPNSFNNTLGFSKVLVKQDCYTCSPVQKNIHIQTFYFNEKGLNIKENGVINGEKFGMQKYFWNKNGSIKSYQNFNTFTSSNIKGEFIQDWLENELTNEVIYEYSDSLMKKIIWLDSPNKKITLEVIFEYDSIGRISLEKIIEYPNDEIPLSFKPNSTDIINFPNINIKQVNYKEFIYRTDTTFTTYFSKEKITGKGIKIENKNNQIIFEETFNLKGDLVYKIINKYNKQGKLILQNIYNTGYDGFGNAYDFFGGDLIKYEYDYEGKLIKKISFYNEKIFSSENYEYIK